jgi:hypothetical protein
MANRAKVYVMLILLPALSMAGCAFEGKYSKSAKISKAGCAQGGTFVNVHYGDSELRVKPIVHVRRGGALEFRLKPDRKASDTIDYKDVNVTIDNKPAKDAWLDAAVTGSFKSTGGKLVVCVDQSLDRDRTYEYLVKVEKVGELDPRARVEN